MRLLEYDGTRMNLTRWAKRLGISPRTLCDRLYKLGWTQERALSTTKIKGRKTRFLGLDERAVVDAYVTRGATVASIASELECSKYPIYAILKSNGVVTNRTTRRYFFDENYFDKIDSSDKAYWLGLFYADGNVSNNQVFALGLQSNDRHILERLASDVKYTGPIKDKQTTRSFNNKPPKTYYTSVITLCSKKFCGHLIKHGVLTQKTTRLAFPKIPPGLRRDFIRGLFDGDGTISFPKSGYITFGICGLPTLLEEVSAVIAEELQLHEAKVSKRTETFGVIQYTAKVSEHGVRLHRGNLQQLMDIRQWLYEGTDLYLNRKKETFDRVVDLPKPVGYTTFEAAALLGVQERTVRRYIKDGHIAATKTGHYRRIVDSEIARFKQVLSSCGDVMPWDGRLKKIGEANQAAKLTAENVVAIRRAKGVSLKALATTYGVSEVSINNVLRGKTWKSVA